MNYADGFDCARHSTTIRVQRLPQQKSRATNPALFFFRRRSRYSARALAVFFSLTKAIRVSLNAFSGLITVSPPVDVMIRTFRVATENRVIPDLLTNSLAQ